MCQNKRRGTHFYYFVCPLICSRAQANPRQKEQFITTENTMICLYKLVHLSEELDVHTTCTSNDLQFYPASLFLPSCITPGPSSPTSLAPLDFLFKDLLCGAFVCTSCPWMAYYLQFCSPSFTLPSLVSQYKVIVLLLFKCNRNNYSQNMIRFKLEYSSYYSWLSWI